MAPSLDSPRTTGSDGQADGLIEFPPRYEALASLGQGGGGQVWAVRDRISARTVALKALGADASEREVLALVREAVALSGLEGLGVPRVLRFGRLPGSGRPFLVRELVEGRSLLELLDDGDDPARCLEALALAADQLTVLHRGSLVHRDVKPANVLHAGDNRWKLADFGIARMPDSDLTQVGIFMGRPATRRPRRSARAATRRRPTCSRGVR